MAPPARDGGAGEGSGPGSGEESGSESIDGSTSGPREGSGSGNETEPGDEPETEPEPEVVVSLPDELRGELKDPFGSIYTDAAALLADASEPLVAVGDVVTYHLLEAGRPPDVALVDWKTKRERVDREIRESIGGFDHRREVVNPPATLTAELITTLVEAIDTPGTVVVSVDGEEDLAALPAIVVAPDGASVVYGQPDEGMVLAVVDEPLRERCRTLLSRMDGDHDRLADLLSR